MSVKSCEVYEHCETCVTTLDPLRCGWCDDRCTTEAQCASVWSDHRCPPVIYSVCRPIYVSVPTFDRGAVHWVDGAGLPLGGVTWRLDIAGAASKV